MKILLGAVAAHILAFFQESSVILVVSYQGSFNFNVHVVIEGFFSPATEKSAALVVQIILTHDWRASQKYSSAVFLSQTRCNHFEVRRWNDRMRTACVRDLLKGTFEEKHSKYFVIGLGSWGPVYRRLHDYFNNKTFYLFN